MLTLIFVDEDNFNSRGGIDAENKDDDYDNNKRDKRLNEMT